jgi:hypothetical protein
MSHPISNPLHMYHRDAFTMHVFVKVDDDIPLNAVSNTQYIVEGVELASEAIDKLGDTIIVACHFQEDSLEHLEPGGFYQAHLLMTVDGKTSTVHETRIELSKRQEVNQ